MQSSSVCHCLLLHELDRATDKANSLIVASFPSSCARAWKWGYRDRWSHTYADNLQPFLHSRQVLWLHRHGLSFTLKWSLLFMSTYGSYLKQIQLVCVISTVCEQPASSTHGHSVFIKYHFKTVKWPQVYINQGLMQTMSLSLLPSKQCHAHF